MKRFSLLFFFAASVWSVCFASGPESKMVIEASEGVVINQPRFEYAEDGDLQFRCRLETKNERLVNAVAYLLFEAVNLDGEEEEVLWSLEKVVLRNQFTKRFGGRVGMYIRQNIEGLPEEYQQLRISFVNRPIEK